MTKKIVWILGMAVFAMILGGCGATSTPLHTTEEPADPETSGDTPIVPEGKGIYLDGPVEGVHYLCGSLEGWTGAQGDFRYEIGKDCTLSIGALSLRTIDKSLLKQKEVIIQETDTRIAKLLLSLDIDPDSDRVQIDPVVARELADPQYKGDLPSKDLRETFNTIRTSLESQGIIIEPIRIVSDDAVIEHLKQTHEKYCDNTGYRQIENVSFLGKCLPPEEGPVPDADNTLPVIHLKGESTVTVYLGSPFTDPGATATDDQDGVLEVLTQGQVDTRKEGTYTLTYMAVDAAGNKALAYRTVQVILPPDNTPPVITLNGASVISIDLNGTFVDPGATATDDRDGDLTGQIVRTGDVDVSQEDTYTLIYRIEDRAGNRAETNRTVIVKTAPDTQAPEIRLKGDNPLIIKKGEAFSDPGVSAFDDRDGDISSNVQRSGSVDKDRVGDYNLTYTVSDRAGNSASAIRVVRVEETPDTTPPVITLAGDNPLVVEQGKPFVDPGATATDDRDGNILVKTIEEVNTSVTGDYPVTYVAEDKAGNRASVTRTVQVVLPPDTTPPVISLKGAPEMNLIQGESFTDPGATANDDRDGDVDVHVKGTVDTSTVGTYTLIYTAEDKAGNEANATRTVKVTADTSLPEYYYIPKEENLTDAMAVKFLNMATFGSTPALIEELRQKGVENWVDDQLAMQYDPKKESLLRRLIRRAINIYPKTYGLNNYDTNATIPESEVDNFLANNNDCFNKKQRNGVNELDIHYGLILDTQVRFPDQIRQRVAYALSQIIVASQSNDKFFYDRGEALSYYYDLLLKHAFGNYGDLLYDVSLSPTMATFLTYANNEKEYTTADGVKVLPDENYGREIMQLFSIGLYELNMDGTEKRVDGKRVPTYVQTDVNEMSRVFTGLTYAHSSWGKILLDGDATHPLECYPDHHDSGEKHVLGHTLPSGQSCEQDVRSAVDLVMGHPNVAPFIAKKLIMRLTKSNPTTAYVQRVAEVFASTGGDLKATTKAVLLDQEIWENIKADKGVKFKEPYMLFTEMIRAFGFKPIPWKTHTYNERTWIEQNPGFLSQSLYSYFGQYPTQSPSVFNFYDDAFVPDDDEFKIRGFVAPELSLYTSSYAVAMNNFIIAILENCSIQKQMRGGENEEKMPDQAPDSYRGTLTQTYMYVDFDEGLDVMRNNGFGESLEENRGGEEETQAREQVAAALVDYVAHKLIGRPLKQDKRQKLIGLYKDRPRSYNDNNNETQFRIMDFWIMPLIVDMVRSDEYMVQ